jgi:hypothetical protein
MRLIQLTRKAPNHPYIIKRTYILKRSCIECGAEYADEDPAETCTNCGGVISPGPVRKANCLLCLDSGTVALHGGDSIKCPRGCKLKES